MTSLHLIKKRETHSFRPKQPISCLTHFIGFLFAVIMTPATITRAVQFSSSSTVVTGITVFMISMILLYAASATYHAFNTNSRTTLNQVLKRIDHMSIFVLIAGSYTPVCLTLLSHQTGTILLWVIWGIAVSGMLFKFCWVNCPKWVSSVLYIAMGWAVLAVMPELLTNISKPEFAWLLSGGLFYTIGGVIYALKLHLIPSNQIGFGNHELFHLFVMAGSFCHFMMMYGYLCLR